MRVFWAYEYVNDFVSINRKKKLHKTATVEVRAMTMRPARLVDAARSGCDQMNLLTSALVSRATRTHGVSLFSTRVRERAQAHHRYAPLWMHPVIDDYAPPRAGFRPSDHAVEVAR